MVKRKERELPAVKAIKPLDIFTREQWTALTRVSPWKAIALLAHAWAVIIAAIAFAIWASHPAAWIAAIIIIGGRQLGLGILMHDGAHGALHPKRKINNALGHWASGIAVGIDLHSYRTYHLSHHRFTQQDEDPDLVLSAPFPVSRASMIRKIARDILGLTFIKQRGLQFIGAVKSLLNGGKFSDHKALFQFWAMQILLISLSWFSGYGLVPYMLWFIALATTFPLFLRIRNIAEHAAAPVGSNDPFTHARTTHANILARATVAPYWVNYHCEHHLFMGVPCYNLPKVHAILSPHHDRMNIAPNYMAVMRTVTR